jgi:uncharacterized protein
MKSPNQLLIIIAALMSGLLFGIGLILAGMANPANVLAFLDLAGMWNPSLAFVMVGGIAVAIAPFAWAKRQHKSLLGNAMQVPSARHIDQRLIGGSLLFGIGWGIAGICPGPAIVLVGAGVGKGVAFVLAMLLGMALFEFIEHQRKAK